jgi:hypothetical protein
LFVKSIRAEVITRKFLELPGKERDFVWLDEGKVGSEDDMAGACDGFGRGGHCRKKVEQPVASSQDIRAVARDDRASVNDIRCAA